MRTGNEPTAPPLVTCGLPPSIRQRSVEVPPASSVTMFGKARHLGNHRAAERACRGSGQRGGDRLAHHLGGAGDAAARLHDQERLVLEIAELVVDAAQIALHVRLDERIDQRGHRALVFAIFRQHVAGQRQRAFGVFLGDDLGDAALVRGVGIGVHQADADGADVRARGRISPRRGRSASSSGRSSSPRKFSRPPASRTKRSGTMRSGFTQKYELP